MRATQTTAEQADELNIVSSVWILSCDDNSALMTYEEVRRRLGLPDNYDLRGMVRKRGTVSRWRLRPTNGGTETGDARW
jgi:hypothetical protein